MLFARSPDARFWLLRYSHGGKRREAGSVAALALRFCVLTAGRSGEVLGARWAEIDLAEAIWTVPAVRMKAGREHRLPLTTAAIAVLRQAAELRTSKAPNAFVFPGRRPGKGLSVMALAMVLRRMDRGDLTVHGFRSTFRDWCAKAKARGYRSSRNLKAMAYLLAGKLDLKLPA